MTRWGRVAVEGESMTPTLLPDDWLLVRWNATVHAGDIVVARRPDRPDLLIVKRAVERRPQGWWLLGDHPESSDDSRLFGVVRDSDVLARCVVRYWPNPVSLR